LVVQFVVGRRVIVVVIGGVAVMVGLLSHRVSLSLRWRNEAATSTLRRRIIKLLQAKLGLNFINQLGDIAGKTRSAQTPEVGDHVPLLGRCLQSPRAADAVVNLLRLLVAHVASVGLPPTLNLLPFPRLRHLNRWRMC